MKWYKTVYIIYDFKNRKYKKKSRILYQSFRPKTASSVEEKSDSSIGGDNKKLANSQQISHNKPTNFQYKVIYLDV